LIDRERDDAEQRLLGVGIFVFRLSSFASFGEPDFSTPPTRPPSARWISAACIL
jgi:hypothetical protein